MATFKHSGSLGDVIYALPSIKSIQRQVGNFSKSTLYLQPDIKDTIPKWAGSRPPVRMSKADAEKLIPLLASQKGIADVALYSGQPVDFDLDNFRHTGFPLHAGNIAQYIAYAYKCSPVLHQQWLQVEPSAEFKNQILVNRTTRYRNPAISYKFLTGKPNVVFVGLAAEYSDFIKDCPRLPLVTARDFVELAGWIAGCKGFIGNQSFCFALAEALKVPRLLEVYPQAPNVVVSGPKGWPAVGQDLFSEIAGDLAK